LPRWEKADVTLSSTICLAALMLAQLQPQAAPAVAPPQAPSRPFGTEPAWPAGDISGTQARPLVGALGEPSPPRPMDRTSVEQSRTQPAQQRVRAPYRQAEEPAPASLEEARRRQMMRLRAPQDWRRDMLESERQSQIQSNSAFRETPVGPDLRPPPEPEPPLATTTPDPRLAPAVRGRLRSPTPY
jgi:hypothetical protein